MQSSSSDCCEKGHIARTGEATRVGYSCKMLMAKGKREIECGLEGSRVAGGVGYIGRHANTAEEEEISMMGASI